MNAVARARCARNKHPCEKRDVKTVGCTYCFSLRQRCSLREDEDIPKTKKAKTAVVKGPESKDGKKVGKVVKVEKGKKAETRKSSKDEARGTPLVIDQGFAEMVEGLAGDVAEIKAGFSQVKRVREVLERMDGHLGELVTVLREKWDAGKETAEKGTGMEVEESEDVEMSGTETFASPPPSSAS